MNYHDLSNTGDTHNPAAKHTRTKPLVFSCLPSLCKFSSLLNLLYQILISYDLLGIGGFQPWRMKNHQVSVALLPPLNILIHTYEQVLKLNLHC